MSARSSPKDSSSSSGRYVVVRGDTRRKREVGHSATSGMLAVLGLAFAVVGLVDIVLLWIPLRFGSVAWEAATVGSTLDGLPMPALGLGLFAFGVVRHPRVGVRWSRVVAIVFFVLTALLVLLTFLYGTAAPAVLDQTPTGAASGLLRATARHGVAAVTYTLAFGVIGVLLWRAGREP